MNKLVYKLTTAASTAALLTGSVASVAFGTTTVTVQGNGSDSENEVKIELERKTEVVQVNNADIKNSVNIKANTGDNEAEDNTGGEVSIDTGDANVSSSVSNSANSNVLSLGCASCPGDTSVTVAGNGSDSENEVEVELKNKTKLNQVNNANVENDINVDAKTGDNEAEDNTGGEVDIETGDAGVTVDIANMVNSNVASIGGEDGEGSLDIEVRGNGAHSENEVEVEYDNDVEVLQLNNADIENDVDVEAETGDNEAEDNTGGEVSIDTGDAEVMVGVQNQANFNGLNLDDCCELDAEIKVANNGSDSENEVELELDSYLGASQTNNFDCAGHDSCADVNVKSNTGDNEVEDSTVGGEDPAIETGSAGADVEISTEANSNVLGDMDFDLPELPDLDDMNGWIMLLLGHFSN